MTPLVLVAVGGGCSARESVAAPKRLDDVGPSPAKPAPPAAPPPVKKVVAAEQASVQIESFDCFKPEAGAAPGAAPSGEGISAWKGGGPAGATWNADELSCAASVRSDCQDGDIATELRVGKALVAHGSMRVHGAVATWRQLLRAPQWEKNFDEVAAPRKAIYRTAIFRLTTSLTCRAPYQLQPGTGPRAEFAVDRAFVAGFARGE